MIKYFFSLLFIIVFFSCKKKQEEEITKQTNKPLLSIIKEQALITPIQSQFLKEIDDWKEYRNLSDFILRFQKTSPNEAISNALELRDLVKSLKDSIKPKFVENNAFNARVNILHNEVLRLADMSYIPSIKAEEINNQVKKIVETYNALNIKINTIFIQRRFEEGIDLKNVYIGIDTTKIDSTSKETLKPKKTIKKHTFKKEKQPRKFFKKVNKFTKKSNRKITRE